MGLEQISALLLLQEQRKTAVEQRARLLFSRSPKRRRPRISASNEHDDG
jgi:hypothetical protein